MELVIEDKDGRIIGDRNLEGSRWEQVGNQFVNLQDIAVEITTRGFFGDMYIRNGNNKITREAGSSPPRSLERGDQIFIAAGSFYLNYYEHHTQIWGEKARDYGIGGSQIEFARAAADELKLRADEFQRVLGSTIGVPPAVRATGQSLLATVDDLLASLKVSVI